MSEPRKEFRQQIAQLHDDTYAQSMDQRRPAADTNEAVWGAQEEALCDAAEAVYAQVLRDVIDVVGHFSIKGTDDMIGDRIIEFAAERGIDLEGTL